MDAVDTIVIGAGLAGASVAARLTGSVRVLEQGSQVASEASAQNAGMVRLLVEDPVERRLALRAEALLAELDGPDSPTRVTGAVHGLVHEPDALDDAVAFMRAAGHVVERLDDVSSLAPALHGAPIRRAWHVPGARIADPHALVRSQLAGLDVRLGVRVETLVIEAGRIQGVVTDQGPVRCDRVVLAAGAWSGQLVAGLGLRRPLHPVRRSLLQTTAHPLSSLRHPWCWLEDLGLYLRPESGGWLVSGCDETVDPPNVGPGSTGVVDADWRDVVSARLVATLPAVSDVGWQGGWTGLRTFAPDRRPILGPDPALPGLIWATGLGGFGVTTHLAVGEAVATWADGGDVPWLRQGDVAPDRAYPRRWPLRPKGTTHGQRLVEG